MSQPTLSILIPTRERAATLRHTLQTATRIRSDAVEIVVSDNASLDDTRGVVTESGDPRVRYVNPGERLPMHDHWEFAVAQSTGRYVMIIGDDDAVVPGGIDGLLASMRDRSAPAYRWPRPGYVWPRGATPAEAYTISPSRETRAIAVRDEARFLMRMGGWRYHDLCTIYHGAIERGALDAVGARAGRLFPTAVPDIFIGLALPSVTDHAVELGAPATVMGVSASSNAGSRFAPAGSSGVGRYARELEAYTLHPRVPSFLAPTLQFFLDTLLVAAELFPDVYEGSGPSVEAACAYFLRVGPVGFSSPIGLMDLVSRAGRELHAGRLFYYLLANALAAARVRLRARAADPFSPTSATNVADFVTSLEPDIPRPA
jgi:hypothetical protein